MVLNEQPPSDVGSLKGTFTRHLGIFITASLACVILSFFDPDNLNFLNLEEYSPIQNLQASLLVAAFLLNVYAIFKFPGQARAFWITLLAVSFFYAWRELDIDKEILGARMFSWSFFAQSDDKLAFRHKLLLGIPSISMTVLWLGHLACRPKVIYKATWTRIQPITVFWGGLHFSLFFMAQIWDKATMIQRHIKVSIHEMAHKDPWAEEAMELLGELAFLLFILTLLKLKPKEPRESWAAARDWLHSAAGARLKKALGGVLVTAGIATLALVSTSIFTFQPSEFEYIFTSTYEPHLRQTALAYEGLSKGQILFLGMGMGMGGLLLAMGFCMATWKLTWLRILSAGVLAVGLGGIPFLMLTPTSRRNMCVRIKLGSNLSEDRIAILRPKLTLAAAMATLPEECKRKLHFDAGEAPTNWTLETFSAVDSTPVIEVRYAFVDGLRTRLRNTFNEFAVHYIEALCLEAAREDGIPLKIFNSKDFAPFRTSGGAKMPEGEWHRWRIKWIKLMTKGEPEVAAEDADEEEKSEDFEPQKRNLAEENKR